MKFTQFKKECKRAFDEVGREQFGQGTDRWKYRDDFEWWFEKCVCDKLHRWFDESYARAFNPRPIFGYDKYETEQMKRRWTVWFHNWTLIPGNWCYDWDGGSCYEEFNETETFIHIRFDEKVFDIDIKTGKFRYPDFNPENLLFFPTDEIKLQASLPTLMKMGYFDPSNAVGRYRNKATF